MRRFFRIIPAYWAYLGFILILVQLGVIKVDPTPFWRSLFFISNMEHFRPSRGWFVGHSWTLSQEEQYYLFFPVLFWTILRGRRAPLFVTVAILYLLVSFESRSSRLHLPFDFTYLDFLAWFKYILAGVLTALAWPRVSGLFRNISVVVPLAILALLATRSFYIGLAHLTVTKYSQPTEALGVMFVIGWLIQNPQSCGFLRWPALQWVGLSSYSLYLWQQLFTGPPILYGPLVLSRLPMGLVLLLTAAALSYYLIEKPCIRLGRKLSARWTGPKKLSDRAEEEEEAAKLPGEKTEIAPAV